MKPPLPVLILGGVVSVVIVAVLAIFVGVAWVLSFGRTEWLKEWFEA